SGIFYYWLKSPAGEFTFMRRTPEGDREVPLAPRGNGGIALAAKGFYYKAANTNHLYEYDEITGRSEPVALGKLPGTFDQFTISPDGRWFASTFLASINYDLMIMEKFH